MHKPLFALLLALTTSVRAAESCAIPPGLTPAPALPAEERRLLPVTRMVLAYYWWPEQCQRPDAAATPGCQAGFGFKVHGLWPDAANGTWPQYCRAPTRLDVATVRANYCMTPSTNLLQHEWVKHGTCHWPTPEAYFGDARRLADGIRLPDMTRLPQTGLTAGALRDAIVGANPQLPRGSLFVGTNRRQWLTEVRVCLTIAYRPMPCENNAIGAPDRVPIRIRMP